ncbi:hypothetical protein [Sphingobium sp. R-7]|uniref:hypothetical protein n=1 Tax=Sphingobium sp. R-7 TaxID=3375449 RepID=UPI00398ABA53
MPKVEAYGVPLNQGAAPKSGIDGAIIAARMMERDLDRRDRRHPVDEDSPIPSMASVRLPKLSTELENLRSNRNGD